MHRPLLRAEVRVVNVDGTEPMQLTGLSAPVATGTPDPELNPVDASTASGDVWNADGTQLVVPQTYANAATGQPIHGPDWLVTFRGPCG